MTKKRFQGTGTAMITPFKSDGSVDEKTLRRFVDFQIDGGIDMLLPCGTTGEGATIDADETDRVVQIVIEQAKRRGAPFFRGRRKFATKKGSPAEKGKKVGGGGGVFGGAP